MFEVFQLVLGLVMSLLDDFAPQKYEVPKLMRDIMVFFIKRECSKCSICSSFFTCYTAQTQKRFSVFFFLNALLKLPDK